MAHLEEMPLFPLHTVLFPHAPLQLHVFEDRYREMVKQCVEFDQPFGIVLIRSGQEVGGAAEPFMVGTAARIDFVHTYEDGRMDVQVHGERRIRVRKLLEGHDVLVGAVEPVTELESENSPRLDALSMRAMECFRMWVQGAFGRPEFEVRVDFPDDPTIVSFLIANFLPVENRVKQHMLEITDTAARLADLIPLIEQQIVEAKTSTLHKVMSNEMSNWISPN